MTLRRALVVVASAAVGLAGFALAASSPVSLTAKGPSPLTTTIGWGDTVIFTNADTVDRTVSIPRVETVSPTINPGGSFVYVFEGRRGRYSFRQLGPGRSYGGAIVVNVLGSVTLTAQPSLVQFGQKVLLSGRSPYPGKPVALSQHPPGGGGEWAPTATTTADSEGNFSLEVRPAQGLRYRAQAAASQLTSPQASIDVRPVLTASAAPRRAAIGRRVTVSARIRPARAAETLALERYDGRRKRWVSAVPVDVKVGSSGRVSFTWRAAGGRSKLRVALKRAATRPGWTTVESRALVVVAS